MQEEIDERKLKGQQIAQTCRIMRRERGGYVVPSQSGSGAYLVQYVNYEPVCECPDYEARKIKCKHAWAVELTINKEINSDGTETVIKTMKVTYGQDWKAYDKAQTHEKELFVKLLSELCDNIEEPTQTGKGRPKLGLRDMAFSSALKVFTTFSLRRFMTDMREAKEQDYVQRIPHFSMVSDYMTKPELTPILIGLILKSSRPLKAVETEFAVDSSGFGTSRFSRWFSFKYGKEVNSRVWLKAHLSCGLKTNIGTGVKITEGHANDCPEFTGLVETTARTFEIKEVSADKAYSSRENVEFVDSMGGTAFIPFKSNTTGKARGSLLWKKLYNYYTFNREEFLQSYHKRSNIESTNNMIKAKFGNNVRSKTWMAQVNEVLLKILCHNICVVIQEMHEQGIEPNFLDSNFPTGRGLNRQD